MPYGGPRGSLHNAMEGIAEALAILALRPLQRRQFPSNGFAALLLNYTVSTSPYLLTTRSARREALPELRDFAALADGIARAAGCCRNLSAACPRRGSSHAVGKGGVDLGYTEA